MPLLDLSNTTWDMNVDGFSGSQLKISSMSQDGVLAGGDPPNSEVVGQWDASTKRITFLITMPKSQDVMVFTGYLFEGVEVDPRGFGDIFTIGGTVTLLENGKLRESGWYGKYLAFEE